MERRYVVEVLSISCLVLLTFPRIRLNDRNLVYTEYISTGASANARTLASIVGQVSLALGPIAHLCTRALHSIN